MAVVYRPACAEDLVRADALVVTTINDLTERHGLGPMATASPPNFAMFSLHDDPRGLWIAEEGRDIRGFAWSWMSGELWFLAQLFVDPTQQGRGIGNELIKLTLEHAQQSGAVHKALITFTFNRVSQGLYVRHGLYPKMPVYFFGAGRERLISGLPEAPLAAKAITDAPAHLDALEEIDTRAAGVERTKHHRYLSNETGTKGLLLYKRGECVGYAYINSAGHIGPLAATRTDVLGDAFTTALRVAGDGESENISAFLPGTCTSALSLAVNHNMRITFPMLLMASPGYGDWAHYLPRNPGFM